VKLKVYTVFDSKAEAYLQPFFMQSRGQAVRAFTELSNDPQHQFSKYAADFTLFEIGEYDDQSGIISSLSAFVPLGTSLEFKSQPMPVSAIGGSR